MSFSPWEGFLFRRDLIIDLGDHDFQLHRMIEYDGGLLRKREMKLLGLAGKPNHEKKTPGQFLTVKRPGFFTSL